MTSWETRPLSECGELLSGGTPSKSDQSYWGGPIPWFSSKEVRGFELEGTELGLTERGAANGTNMVTPGAVLFVVRGMSLANEFRVGVTKVAAAFNQDVKALVPRADVDARYLARCLGWLEPDVLGMTEESSHGTKRLPSHVFEHLSIPLPPLPEQRRLADILDRADAIRRKRKEAIALTEELLRSAFFEMFGDPVTNPKRWPEVSLGELADVASGVAKGKKYVDVRTVSVPYMRVANVQDGRLDLGDVAHITVAEDEVRRYLLRYGDVLLTEGGDPDKLGRGAVWRDEVPGCIHQNHIFRVRPGETVLPEYLSALIGSPRGKRYFLQAAKQTTGIATINMGQLKRFSVLVPPLKAQRRYVDALVTGQLTLGHLREALGATDELFMSLVHKAFHRELSAA